MIHESEKLNVIYCAREWARAERRLREVAWIPGSDQIKEYASKESDRTEVRLLEAVRDLEKAEDKDRQITFFGRVIKVGDRIDDLLYTWLEHKVREEAARAGAWFERWGGK